MSPRQVDPQTLHDREQAILDAAMDIIQQQGVEGLTMDKLVRAVPYSKGTVYSHFIGKEDLLLALCNRGMVIFGHLFRRAHQFQGHSREQLLAVHFSYLLYSRLHPMMFMLVISAMSPGTIEKASAKQREAHQQQEAELSRGIIDVIQHAIAGGECQNPAALDVKQIAFANWSSSFGSISLLSQDVERCGIRSELCSEQALINNINLILDGLCWRPLQSEFDYSKTLEKLKTDVFAPEIERLRIQGEALQL